MERIGGSRSSSTWMEYKQHRLTRNLALALTISLAIMIFGAMVMREELSVAFRGSPLSYQAAVKIAGMGGLASFLFTIVLVARCCLHRRPQYVSVLN